MDVTCSFSSTDGCVRFYNSSSGVFSSESYPSYVSDTDCLYIVTNPTGQPMKLTFTDLNLAGDGDSVEVKQRGAGAVGERARGRWGR